MDRIELSAEKSRGEWKKLLALPFVILFTIYDIWIGEGLFTPLQIWDSAHVYHLATFYFLVPLLNVLISLGLKSWQFFMYSAVGISFGWLDILYFLLQGKALPSVYTWLLFSPTNYQLIACATISLFLAIYLDWKVKSLDLIRSSNTLSDRARSALA